MKSSFHRRRTAFVEDILDLWKHPLNRGGLVVVVTVGKLAEAEGITVVEIGDGFRGV